MDADGLLEMFHCPYEGCSQVYVALSSFQNHVNLVHRKGKTKVCPHPGCGKKFYLSNHLRRHMIIHSGQALPAGTHRPGVVHMCKSLHSGGLGCTVKPHILPYTRYCFHVQLPKVPTRVTWELILAVDTLCQELQSSYLL